MKKIFAYQVILLLLSLSFIVASCGDDDERSYNIITEDYWFVPDTFTYKGFKYEAIDEQTALLYPKVSYQNLYDVQIPLTVPYDRYTLKVAIIGNFAFFRCNNLKSVVISDNVKKINDSAFGECVELEQVHLGNGVKKIGEMAFAICKKLQSITIPDGVETIELQAFFACEKLEQIELPQNLNSVKYEAFSGCKSLRKIELPKTIKEIGEHAFGGCTSLESFVCGAQQPPTLGTDVFKDVNLANSTLYVPSGSVDIYKAADQWKEFGTILAKEN